jgi:hypothetical protein
MFSKITRIKASDIGSGLFIQCCALIKKGFSVRSNHLFFSGFDHHNVFTAKILRASGYQHAAEHGIVFGPVHQRHFPFREVVPKTDVVFIEHGAGKRRRKEYRILCQSTIRPTTTE